MLRYRENYICEHAQEVEICTDFRCFNRIGHEAALALGAKGYHVFGTVRKEVDSNSLVGALSDRFTPLQMDVTDEQHRVFPWSWLTSSKMNLKMLEIKSGTHISCRSKRWLLIYP